MAAVRQVGDWATARRILATGPRRFQLARRRALAQEAQLYRRELVQGLTSGRPGGKTLAPLQASTVETRRARGIRGTKPLIARGDTRRAIAVHRRGDDFFVGVLRSARGKDGRSLVDLLQVHEFGKTIVTRITPQSRRFIAMVMRRAGRPRPSAGQSNVAVIRIPARPLFNPVFTRLSRNSAERVVKRVARLLAGDFGLV